MSISQSETYTTTVSTSARGVGYAALEGFEQDIEIVPEKLGATLNGDTVELKLLPPQKDTRRQGEVVRVITRAKTHFVGTIEKTKDGVFVISDDRRMYLDIELVGTEASSAQNGYKVYVELNDWTDATHNPTGRVKEVIGRKGVHEVEMKAITLEKGISTAFPSVVEKEAEEIAKHAAITDADLAERRDFRDTLTFTIDPEDAKDFDDALSYHELENGDIELGVHIADVAHYVTPDSALDKEAIDRGVSVYLVDRTIPMLPEVLSNDLCSLNPHEEKRAFSAVFVLDTNAEVKERWFGRTLIRSDHRFTYEAAQESIDAQDALYGRELHTINELAKKLKAQRTEAGAIEFEESEVRFELDQAGKPIAVHRKDRLDAHKLVEEFMLLANRGVAEYVNTLEEKTNDRAPFVYRVHDLPNPEKIEMLTVFLHALGHELPVSEKGVSSQDLNALFKRIEGEASEALIKTAAIRAMAKAVYSTANIGHYGLALGYYTHFTSPIRRYPDILVHRLLARYLAGEKVSPKEIDRLHQLAMHTTDREVQAVEAERASIKYKQVEYMRDAIGKEFDAVISGVSEWGIFVEEAHSKAEGMVRMRDLKNDFYELDKKQYRVVGKRTNKSYTLGDSLRVKLTAADMEKRTLDFVLV